MPRYFVEGDARRPSIWIAVSTILMDDWDPIGVRDEPLAADEYEAYIPQLITMVTSGASEQEFMAFLSQIETKRMGFSENRERGREAARCLVKLSLSRGA